MLDNKNGPLTYLRFGISRKKEFLKDARKAYNGLVLPANILLYQYKSTPSVVYMCDQPFFIDPMSYLFGQPYEAFKQKVKKRDPGFKPSFHKLMLGHGLKPEKFLHTDYKELLQFLCLNENLNLFIENAFNFQYNSVWDVIKEAESLLTQEERQNLNEEKFRPNFIIPPYFLYTPNTNSKSITTELNERILEICSKEINNRNIFPMIFIEKESLENQEFINEIIEIVKKFRFPGYVLWIEDFDERYASKNQIKKLISLIRRISSEGQQILMLFGGFFSLLLYYYGVTCVCHGLAYGEARTINASTQENAGPAPIRYYIRDLHSFLTLENALIVLRKRPDLICSCSVCQRIIRDNPENVTRFENEETLAEMHFLYNRFQERKMIGNSRIEEIIEHLDWIVEINNDLRDITKRYKTRSGIEDKSIIDPSYINTWKEALMES